MIVNTAEKLEIACRKIAGQVARFIQPRARLVTEGIRYKPRCGQLGAVQVASCDLHTANMQFPRHSNRHGIHVAVQHIDLGIGHGSAYGNKSQTTSFFTGPVSDIYGRFGRSIEVVQFCTQIGEEAFLQIMGQGFSTANNPFQAAAIANIPSVQKQLEHRRYEVERRDSLFDNEVDKIIRVSMPAWLSHHQLRAEQERPEELPNRHIETKGGLLQNTICLGKLVGILHPKQTVADSLMTVQNPFGPAGGP